LLAAYRHSPAMKVEDRHCLRQTRSVCAREQCDEAIQFFGNTIFWIASSLTLLAMTALEGLPQRFERSL
jgi:hypothetical protein